MTMRKRWMVLITAGMLLAVACVPAFAEGNAPEGGKPAGKHNFDQFQTIKRLEVRG
jgi:hypothetical protein